MTERALYFTGERTVEHRSVESTTPGPDEVRLATIVSAISPGTERLVYRGDVPREMPRDVTIDTLEGDFSFPLRYGYAVVGEVVAVGRDVEESWLGRTVFSFAPHQTTHTVSLESVIPVPETIDSETASLFPTVETAVNLVLDASPTIGERVVLFGAGPIGLATTHVLAAFPLSELVVVEPIDRRRETARAFGADTVIDPNTAPSSVENESPSGADLAIELSGRPETMNDAIDSVGYDGRIVVGSWYGTKQAPIDLGGSYHRENVTVQSSQVSRLAPRHRGRWTTARRRTVALEHLARLDTEALITDQIPFDRAEEAYRRLDETDEAIQILLTYEPDTETRPHR